MLHVVFLAQKQNLKNPEVFSEMAKVAIIGGGVIGFSTAYNLKKACPHLDVTLLSESFSPETCSDVAAGIWEPFVLKDTPMELQRFIAV